MPTLHFGVLVQPYTYGKKAMTTGDVAEILEAKYGVMAAFFKAHERDVIKSLENSMAGALESLIMGAPKAEPYAGAASYIEGVFRTFISSREAERVIAGAPTKAALAGVNHRLAHPYAKKNPRRPSFKDTGLYMTSFKSWVDDK